MLKDCKVNEIAVAAARHGEIVGTKAEMADELRSAVKKVPDLYFSTRKNWSVVRSGMRFKESDVRSFATKEEWTNDYDIDASVIVALEVRFLIQDLYYQNDDPSKSEMLECGYWNGELIMAEPPWGGFYTYNEDAARERFRTGINKLVSND